MDVLSAGSNFWGVFDARRDLVVEALPDGPPELEAGEGERAADARDRRCRVVLCTAFFAAFVPPFGFVGSGGGSACSCVTLTTL